MTSTLVPASTGGTDDLISSQPSKVADVKYVLLGESSVGKSSILQRFQSNSFSEGKAATIGAAFVSKKILKREEDGTTSAINMQIWDTAGQERFHNLTPLYYRNANVALVVFDLTDEHSFKKAEYWINELKEYQMEERGQMQVILIGNKYDLLPEGELSKFDAELNHYMNSHAEVTRYFTTSAKKNIGITELFDYTLDNLDASLYHDIEEENEQRQKNGFVDLRITGRVKAYSCQC